MTDFADQFLIETKDALGALKFDVLQLGQGRNDLFRLDRIANYMNLLKTTSRFLGLPDLEVITRNAENFLKPFREGQLMMSYFHRATFLEAFDRMLLIVANSIKPQEIAKEEKPDTITSYEMTGMSSSLVVMAGGKQFALPQSYVREIIKASPGARLWIKTEKNRQYFQLRGQLIPLFSLKTLMKSTGRDTTRENPPVVVIQLGKSLIGLMVDSVMNVREAAPKPAVSASRYTDVFKFASSR